jgi:RNA polymerase sigma-70 factor (ECF subfamily)
MGDLEDVFREHHRRVFQAAYRVTGNAADAEDVLSTIFLRLLHQGGPIEHVASYLHRAAVNTALDLVRARHDRGRVPLEDVAPVLAQDARLRPDRRQQVHELRACLRSAIARLKPKAAEMFVLRYLEGYGNREIARMLGASQINVSVTLHRSRRQLQRYLRSSIGVKP